MKVNKLPPSLFFLSKNLIFVSVLVSIYSSFVAALFISNIFKTVTPGLLKKSETAYIIVGYVLLLVMVIGLW